ncbi:MAG: sigma-70 family RNA polymerase sigma factor [Ardenticatenaceae bacterium]|nr:sigma-70 family RNA polymerase sigma factor [Anaerolineales bacterium]MCB8984990.1 sigma-70 family RNA polymerase sigma factor [Ardenticatenaceae bacterium]MCB8987918.1 sigma-70 family RNA polymerase sigma factor [Ardenticatenaceae bacterium]
MSKRTNEQWLHDLKSSGPAHEAAISDLQQILLSGLQHGLLNQVNTSAPEFATQAEDFIQEALLKILDNLDSFAGRSQFTTWAHKIAVSVALTELRRKRWQDKSLDGLMETDSGIFTPKFIADPAPLPESVTERAEMLAHVNRLIMEELTEKQQAVMEKSVIQNLPTPEVARQLHMKPNAVYKMLHDARVRLKQRLAEDGLTPEEILAIFE